MNNRENLKKEIIEFIQSDDEKIRVEIYTLDNKIFIQRVTPCCAFCDREDNLVEYRGKMICKYCLNDLTKQI